jgi:hypothetical protein
VLFLTTIGNQTALSDRAIHTVLFRTFGTRDASITVEGITGACTLGRRAAPPRDRPQSSDLAAPTLYGL